VRFAAAAFAALAVLLPGSSSAAKVFPARVQVTAKEFFYALSSHTVKSGPAIVELVNFGEDSHDMRIERVGGTHVYGTPILQPGKYYDLGIKLLPGKYKLWCSIANHRALGMNAVLVVRPR
jgi:plastocyanin